MSTRAELKFLATISLCAYREYHRVTYAQEVVGENDHRIRELTALDQNDSNSPSNSNREDAIVISGCSAMLKFVVQASVLGGHVICRACLSWEPGPKDRAVPQLCQHIAASSASKLFALHCSVPLIYYLLGTCT